jgi:hypothetical protein
MLPLLSDSSTPLSFCADKLQSNLLKQIGKKNMDKNES